MKTKMKLISWDSWGSISFMIDTKKYKYHIDDGALLIRIVSIAKKTPGKALNLAKKYGHLFNG